MISRTQLCAVLVTSMLGFAPVEAQMRQDVLRWNVAVADAEPLAAPETNAYRLFQETSELVLDVSLFNDSRLPIIIPTGKFVDGARVRITSTSEIPVEARWESEVRHSRESYATPLGIDEEIRVEPSAGLQWKLVVRPLSDGFKRGKYRLDISMANAFASISGPESAPWKGHILPNFRLHLDIGSPSTAAETATMYNARGKAALQGNQVDEAIDWFTRATKASPADVESWAGLGHAYLAKNRYREAISAYESVIGIPGNRAQIHQLLALAYVGAGDEGNAVRVLRVTGKPETSIAPEIERLRGVVRRRPVR
jgi:tetratricopeptide (TPR) repeat protein